VSSSYLESDRLMQQNRSFTFNYYDPIIYLNPCINGAICNEDGNRYTDKQGGSQNHASS